MQHTQVRLVFWLKLAASDLKRVMIQGWGWQLALRSGTLR